MALEVTNENFEQEVLKSDKPVMVDFWSHGCPPCRMIAPILDRMDAENEDFKIVKVNAADNVELARAFGISAVPTLVFFKDGKMVKKEVGFRSEDVIKEQFESMK